MAKTNKPIVIFGASGQLARGLAQAAMKLQLPVRLVARAEADLNDLDSCIELLDSLEPEIVINGAAHTNVDWCESHQEEAHWVNAVAPGELAEWCADNDSYFVHFSTDYVFDGKKDTPYLETDAVNPLSWYGRTKLEGEDAVTECDGDYLIARVSWLYSAYRPSFVHSITEQTESRRQPTTGATSPESIRVVSDQIGTPTAVDPLADQLLRMIQKRCTGIYHVACSGEGSRFDMARLIVDELKLSVPLVPCTTKEYPRPAERPHYSALDSARLKQERQYILPGWQEALSDFVKQTWPVVRS